MCIAFFLGGQLYFLFITLPASYAFFNLNDQIRYLQNTLRRQNPVLLLALCLAVLTGGFMITPIKGAMGTNYLALFSPKLLTKLGFFFIVFFISAYQTLAVGFKIRFLDPARGDGTEERQLASVRFLMVVTAVLNIIFTGITIHYGMMLRG
jgi:hypothetical protein